MKYFQDVQQAKHYNIHVGLTPKRPFQMPHDVFKMHFKRKKTMLSSHTVCPTILVNFNLYDFILRNCDQPLISCFSTSTDNSVQGTKQYFWKHLEKVLDKKRSEVKTPQNGKKFQSHNTMVCNLTLRLGKTISYRHPKVKFYWQMVMAAFEVRQDIFLLQTTGKLQI